MTFIHKNKQFHLINHISYVFFIYFLYICFAYDMLNIYYIYINIHCFKLTIQ